MEDEDLLWLEVSLHNYILDRNSRTLSFKKLLHSIFLMGLWVYAWWKWMGMTGVNFKMPHARMNVPSRSTKNNLIVQLKIEWNVSKIFLLGYMIY